MEVIMENKIKFFMKRVLIFIGTLALVLSITSCGLFMTDQQSTPVETILDYLNETDDLEETDDLKETDELVENDDLKETVFENDIKYLSGKGIQLPDLPPNSTIMEETFLSLLTETYESLGTEIDISKVNPRNESSDAIKKMILIGVYDGYFMKDDMLSSDLDYGTVAYWLMKLQETIQTRLYLRNDSTAWTGDLLRRINVSSALHTWTQDAKEVRTYTLSDLLGGEAEPEQLLTRLTVAEMLVSAYEAACGEIQTTQTLKPKDTDDINAWKSNEFFFWSETGNFEPEKTGNWDDWAFMSAIVYDSQLRLGLKLDESKTSYGAVIAALASMMRDYEGLEQNRMEEKIVLNERPYNWYVYQQESGEYSAVNCMPACVEMSMRYQGLSDIPTVEKLRKDNLWNGLGWHDEVAENVMVQYGLKFTESTEIRLDKMLDLLDKGNILYVMYNKLGSQEGHSVIIKGYWMIGSSVNFIVSDPNYNMLGPFGYLENTMDAQTMLSDIERHVPRYFIIPKGE
jgi:hypothetical protein